MLIKGSGQRVYRNLYFLLNFVVNCSESKTNFKMCVWHRGYIVLFACFVFVLGLCIERAWE